MNEKYVLIDGGKRRRLVVETNCVECKNIFWVRKSWVDTQRYCSVDCRIDASKTKVDVQCAYCCTEFKLRPSQLRKSKSGLYFCCRKHKDLAQRIGGIKEIQPDHYGTTKVNYRDIAFRNFEVKCADCGYNEYKEVLDVHHIDRNRENNDLSNLVFLCPTCHRVRHFKEKTGWYLPKK